jgi:hypothetical protein
MLGGVTYTVLMGPAGGPPVVPLPPPLLTALQKIEVETSTEMASVFRLRFGISQMQIGDWDLLMPQYEETFFRPLSRVQIRVKVGIDIPKTIINGYITHQHVLYDDEGGASSMEITGMDATILMNLQEKVITWPLAGFPTDSLIAITIFGQYGLLPMAIPGLPMNVDPSGTDSTVQRGTDIRFLRRLAQRSSFECFVRPDPFSGVDIGYFGPPANLPFAPEAVLNVKMGAQTNVTEFKIRYDMVKPTLSLAFGLDTMTRVPLTFPSLPSVAAGYPVGPPMGVQEATIREVGGPHPPPMVLAAQTGMMSLPGLPLVNQAITNKASWAVVAEGTAGSDVGVLSVGFTVNIRGAGLAFNGAYYVTRVSHVIESGGCSYIQKFEARRNAIGMTGAELYLQLPA